MNKLRRFFQLPPIQRWAVLVAWWMLLIFWSALRTMSFRRVARMAAIPLRTQHRELEPDTLGWCVRAAAGTHILPMHCLERSLTLQRLLRRQGVEADLRIGVRNGSGSLEAHAWLEVAGNPIVEPEGIDQRFAPLEWT